MIGAVGFFFILLNGNSNTGNARHCSVSTLTEVDMGSGDKM